MTPTHPRNLSSTFCLCCVAMAGCDEGNSASNSASNGPSRDDPAVQEARSPALEHKEPTRVPPERPAAVQGEVPQDVMERVRNHLAQRTGASADTFEVQRSEWHEWPSGAMGCPQPGMHYTQSLVQGYWIVLRHDGRDYDYRVAQSGHLVICEGMRQDGLGLPDVSPEARGPAWR